MKKVLVAISAFAIALSISSASFADSIFYRSGQCCGAAASMPVYSYLRPNCCQKTSIYTYYQVPTCCKPVQPCCRPIAPTCCGAAAPVQPCCEEAKPACPSTCGCHKAKKHIFKKHKKVKCNCK